MRIMRIRCAASSESLPVSIGLGQRIGKMEPIERAVTRADEALQRAKQGGRNRIECNRALPQSAA